MPYLLLLVVDKGMEKSMERNISWGPVSRLMWGCIPPFRTSNHKAELAGGSSPRGMTGLVEGRHERIEDPSL